MAYSKAPTQDTYSSERVSLFREIATRDGGLAGKDEDYVNVFMEVVKQNKTGDQRRFVVKRCGTASAIASVAASNIRGMHFWADENKLLYCVGRNVYVYNVGTASSTTLTNAFATSTGAVGFCEFLYDDGTVKVVASDGSATSGIITIDTANTVVTASDVDIPAHHPTPVFLDGYLFIAETNTANIWNSELNNPLSFVADTFIATEMEADKVVKIAKLNNYIIAFGKTSVEYFWDAANPAPDSPLQRNDTPVKINTYLAGFAVYGNTVYYIGSDASGQPDIFMLKDFKIESIGTPSISRYLNTVTDSISSWVGTIVSFQGHTFYLVNAGNGKSWAIDVDTGLVTRFAFQSNSTFDILESTNVISTSNARTYFALDNGTSTIYKFDESVYQDAGTNFTCSVVTEANDFGTLNRKFMHRLSIVADRPSSSSNISVQWSDDDYETFSTARSIDLKQDLSSTYQLGWFRQRIFKFTYTDNYPMRIQDIEVDINKGTT